MTSLSAVSMAPGLARAGDPVLQVAIGEANDDYGIALSSIIALESDLECVGMASGVDELVALVTRARPDAVVVDANLPVGGIRALADGLSQAKVRCRIVVLSALPTPNGLIAALEAGASGVVPKVDGPAILSALRALGD